MTMTTPFRTRLLRLCFILMVLIGLTACQISPALNRIFASQITTQDLPSGFRRYGAQIKDIPEAEGRLFIFYTADSQMTSNVSEELYVYKTVDAASKSYDAWVDSEIPPHAANSWITPKELVFTGRADQMRVACLPGVVNSQSNHACGAIGRYGDTIVILRGIVIDPWLTMADLRRLLEAMDRRIVAAMK